MTELDTLSGAEMARAAALDALREASEAADRMTAALWESRSANRSAWAKAVLAESSATASRLAAEETAARRAFEAACADVAADPRAAYLLWTDARAAVNVDRDRSLAARSILGRAQDDDGYVFRDTPSYSESVDRALASEVSARMGDASGALQTEINAIDR